MGLPEKTGNGQEETGGAGGEPAEPTGGNRPFRCVEMAAKSGEEVWSRPPQVAQSLEEFRWYLPQRENVLALDRVDQDLLLPDVHNSTVGSTCR